MLAVVSASKNGRRRLIATKLCVLCAAAALLCLLAAGIRLAAYLRAAEETHWDAPLLSFPAFAETDTPITVAQWLFARTAMQIVFHTALAALCFDASFRIRNAPYAYAAVLAATFLPRLLAAMGVGVFRYADAVALLSSTELYLRSAEAAFDWGTAILYLALAGSAAAVFALTDLRRCEKGR